MNHQSNKVTALCPGFMLTVRERFRVRVKFRVRVGLKIRAGFRALQRNKDTNLGTLSKEITRDSTRLKTI